MGKRNLQFFSHDAYEVMVINIRKFIHEPKLFVFGGCHPDLYFRVISFTLRTLTVDAVTVNKMSPVALEHIAKERGFRFRGSGSLFLF